jgi:argininosuccinate synthase|eukprot:TRINITY_DN5216_c0_g1_i1.p2 TRINITY_DN5216_c0_g1~~TRINITY_DN5216_c0_g1_i1.p2  ORF type:complete len:435 (+),score=267.13 TRINITY_DN5216_c0_g1_i1:106-1410(+)
MSTEAPNLDMETHVETYVKIASHEARKGEFKRCLLLYSGGLDTSVMLKWIQDKYESEVVALTINVGQTADDLDAIKAKALRLGAVEAIVIDAREEFANTMLTEAIKANSDYEGGYALGCPLARVLISKVAVRVARETNCAVVAHGCTGKGNDQVRFESYITTLGPELKCIAPVREWGMGREEEVAYALKHGIEVKQTSSKIYSYDENMWANTAEGAEIEDPAKVPNYKNILLWCKVPEEAPEESETVDIEFVEGVPVALNGKKGALHDIIADLNTLGGKHACGVFTLIEDRLVGLKVRGVYENPAASILISAHKKLEMLVCTRDEVEFKESIDQKWAAMVYNAKWYSPLMYHLSAYLNSVNKKVTGTVKVKLYKGSITVISLESKFSLFNSNLATFERDGSFNQNASAGFIEIYSLAQRTAFNVFDYEATLGKN